MSDQPEIYYFGCIRETGHFLYAPGGNRIFHSSTIGIACGGLLNGLDGTFCPPDTWPERVYQLSRVGRWQILSFWDRSVDRRPGSHSTFVYRGLPLVDDIGMLDVARAQFPEVFSRQPGPIISGCGRPEFPFEK